MPGRREFRRTNRVRWSCKAPPFRSSVRLREIGVGSTSMLRVSQLADPYAQLVEFFFFFHTSRKDWLGQRALFLISLFYR